MPNPNDRDAYFTGKPLDWAERGLAIYGEDADRDENVDDLKDRIGKYEEKLGR